MSEENNPAAPAAPAPTIDIDAKLTPITNAIAEMNARNAELQASMQAIVAATQKPAPKEEISPYDADFVEKVVSRSISESNKETARQLKIQQEKQATINSLALDYPELAKADSDLTKAMVKAHASLPAHLKDTPEGYRLAAREAAANEGIVVKSKRKATEDFSMSSSGASDVSPRKNTKAEASEVTLEFAELFGLDTSDKKLVERLAKHSQRDYKNYR